MIRRYCGIVGCGIDAEGDRCPECGAPWSKHREIDATRCGAWTRCANCGRGHHCELAPGHAGEHRTRGCEVTT